MYKKDKKRYLFVLVVSAILILGIGFSGCIGEDDDNGDDDNGEDNGDDDNGEDNGDEDNGEDNGLTGSNTYSGEWSGKVGGEDRSGQWEFTVDFDNEDVSGWFEGDGSGDIEGTVSDGEIDASGEAGFGYVEWSGEFTSDGEDISGTWEVEEEGYQIGSGTWSGELGELDNGNGDDDDEEEEEPLPEEDQVEGDEPMERYPDSVMLAHTHTSTDDGNFTEIEYGTYDSLDDVVDWYEDEFGDPAQKQEEEGQTTLIYFFGEEDNESAEIVISEGDDYTEIELNYLVEN